MKPLPISVLTTLMFVVVPGTLLGVIPWRITRWEITDITLLGRIAQGAGVFVITAGLVLVVDAFVQFAKAGGTPAPPLPPQRLVVSGFHRYIRNPIYFGWVLVVLGEALLFESLTLVVYAAAIWLFTAAFVRTYEERTLAERFGSEYEAYKRNVRGWIPRLRPWTPDSDRQLEAGLK
jgi:protein-S-isoprenylcysteine O-methyltransferase Ste14